jgi:hypothetical protein
MSDQLLPCIIFIYSNKHKLYGHTGRQTSEDHKNIYQLNDRCFIDIGINIGL